MKDIPLHELCKLFPPCSPEEMEALQEDIEKNGLIEPIVLLDGKILDGRNRYTACFALQVEPKTVEYDGDDPVAYVLSKNLHRRHLDTSQRAMVAAKIANLPVGRNWGTKSNSANLQSKNSVADAAKLMQVSERQVAKARQVMREHPEEVEAVKNGEKTINAVLHKKDTEKAINDISAKIKRGEISPFEANASLKAIEADEEEEYEGDEDAGEDEQEQTPEENNEDREISHSVPDARTLDRWERTAKESLENAYRSVDMMIKTNSDYERVRKLIGELDMRASVLFHQYDLMLAAKKREGVSHE